MAYYATLYIIQLSKKKKKKKEPKKIYNLKKRKLDAMKAWRKRIITSKIK